MTEIIDAQTIEVNVSGDQMSRSRNRAGTLITRMLQKAQSADRARPLPDRVGKKLAYSYSFLVFVIGIAVASRLLYLDCEGSGKPQMCGVNGTASWPLFGTMDGEAGVSENDVKCPCAVFSLQQNATYADNATNVETYFKRTDLRPLREVCIGEMGFFDANYYKTMTINNRNLDVHLPLFNDTSPENRAVRLETLSIAKVNLQTPQDVLTAW